MYFQHQRFVIFISILLIIIALTVIFAIRNPQLSPSSPEMSPAGVSLEQVQSPFEGDQVQTDIRKESFPDGRDVEFGTHNGPLNQRRLDELKKIVEEGKQSNVLFRIFSHHVYAADSIDSLVIQNESGKAPDIDSRIRELFRTRAFLWTPQDLKTLKKIIIVKRQADLSGALGIYDFVAIKEYGKFKDWMGVIYLWVDADLGVTLSHEYGHHYTNYWAAHRTAGSWTTWPEDDAGDYYSLRPLPDDCHCRDSGCPYGLRIWEIIAEDYRSSVSDFPDGHIFADQSCRGGGRKVNYPDDDKIAPYFRFLPTDESFIPPQVEETPSVLTQANSDTNSSIPQQPSTNSAIPVSTSSAFTPTPWPTTSGPCGGLPEMKSLKLGVWQPCPTVTHTL